MPINSNGLSLAALTWQSYVYAQLHSGSAGITNMDNLAVPGRVFITWTQPNAGSFGIQSALKFVSGTPGGAVHSITLWDAITDGNCVGEFLLTGGDSVFNGDGEFVVTAIDFTTSASDTA